jgi:hypothetical protein
MKAMPGSHFPIRVKSTKRSLELKEAIVASFALDPAQALLRLSDFEQADWLSVLWWLDTSGMAIYFFDRAREIGADAMLPLTMELALAQRLNNNRTRMKSLLAEARALALWLQRGNIAYALLKGVTLTPHSVAESALRSQADLDFLVAEGQADLAIHYAHRLGYRLHAQSEKSLEFRAGAPSIPALENIYSAKTQRALELHLATEGSCEMQLLSRRVMREFDGAKIHALYSADIMIEQARHLLKHLCGEHTRLSWVLEFWRHIRSRREDTEFWHRAESCAAEARQADLAMGTAAWLAEELFGGIQAEIPVRWRSEALPFRVRLWLERYARGLLLSDTIGNKLYALLRREVPGSANQPRSTCQIILPRVLPAAILEAQPHENRLQRWARYRVEADFILRRLWFHLREGIRFGVEASRWNRAAARVGR